MAALVFFNGVATTCASQISATQTSIVGQSTATWSPTGDYFVRIDGTAPGTSSAIFEFVRVTANVQGSGTITVLRGQGSTQGQAFAANATLTPVMDATAVNAALVRLDSGATQAMQAPITVPPGSGLSVPASSFGSYPVKIDDILVGTDSRYPAATSRITFLNTANSGTNLLPTIYRHLLIEWLARGDTAATTTNLLAVLNNDTAANYDDISGTTNSATTLAASESLGVNNALIGTIPAATATANYFGQGEAKLKYYNSTTSDKLLLAHYCYAIGNATTNGVVGIGGSKWRTTNAAITRLDLLPAAGNFLAGSLFTLYGIP